jgi:hypothetical protein
MDPITITIVAVTLLTGGFWPYIVDILSTKIIPWLRQHISNAVADIISDLVIFADKGITPVRRTLKSVWANFKETVLGIKVEVTKTSATTSTGITTTLVRNSQGKVMQTEVTEELSWDSLPEKIRSEMTRQNTTTAEIDLKKAFEEKIQQRAAENGITLEMTH